MRAINLIAEGKMLALLLTRATVAGSPEHRRLLVRLNDVSLAIGKHLTAVGPDLFPHGLLVEARAYELLLERLRE